MSDAATDRAATDDAAYFAGVVAEIEAEAHRRTESGDYPRALLRSLDEEFRRWIPDAGRASGVEDAIRSIEAAAYVDPGVPVESDKRVGVYVKTAVRKATYFYHRHMAQQIAALGIQVTRPMRLLDATTRQLDERLAALEHLADVNATVRDELVAGLELSPLGDAAVSAAAEHLTGAPGRVAVGEVTDAGLLGSLTEHGVDAYGVGPGVERHSTHELRDQTFAAHLAGLEPGSLGGAVLVGVPDVGALNEQLHLLQLVLRRVVDGGRVVVVVHDLERWRSVAGPVADDLVRGRPLHIETWRHLLEREGATVDRVVEANDHEARSLVVATTAR